MKTRLLHLALRLLASVARLTPRLGALALLAVLLAHPAAVSAVQALTIIYVVPDGAGTQDGTSWANAQDLAVALPAAASGSELWVQSGTYKPATGGLADPRTASFQLQSGVAVYGGFAGTETARTQRNPNPATNGTILSGDLNGDDGPNFANNTDNSYNVATGSGTDATAILDGFTISGGNAFGGNGTGGGMYNNSGSPTLTNITFSSNSALNGQGGGMYNNQSSNPTLTNVTFSGNSAQQGGGMYNNTSSSPTLTNVTFSGNSASQGGGMYNNSGSPTLTNVTFNGNSAQQGGGMDNQSSSSPTIRNSILWGDGGGEILGHSATVTYSLVQGSGGSANWNSGFGTDGGHNLDADPLFATPIDLNANPAPTTTGNLRLTSGSPAIDAGDQTVTNPSLPATDLDGDPRVIGTNVDLGAYEFLLANSALSVVTTGSALNLATATGALPPPQGGTGAFSGPGVSNGVFTPAAAGVYPLTYTVTDSHGTSISANFTVTVLTPTLYVNASVAVGGTGLGDSWADAFPSLATALALADRTPGVTQIWVAQGTYQPAGPNGNRNATFQLRSGLAIYGGFSGTETALAQRNPNPATNGTILSGDLNGDDVGFTHNHENSYAVVTGSGTDATAVLDGFTISGANANGNSPQDKGGGMFNNAGSPTLTNLTFSGNSAVYGGGMCNNGGSPTLTDVTFSGNSAQQGGGMYNNSGSPTLTNLTFSGNSASQAGGMYNSGSSSPTLTDVTFSGNSASQAGGMYNANASPAIRNSILWGNSGGEIVNASSTATVTHSLVQGSGGSANWNSDFGTDGGANLDEDPLFATPITAAAPTTTGNLRLTAGSPAIDAGDQTVTNPSLPATDLDGNQRVIGANVDLGAYELFLPPTLTNNMLIVTTASAFNLATATGASLPPQGDTSAFSATGVAAGAINGNTFNPSALPPGVYTLTYTVTDSHGASNSVNFTVTVPALTLYVNAQVVGGTGAGDSWANAFPSLATALALADSTRSVTQIWVAQGTYTPAGPNGNPNATFQLRSGLAIYGGFTGTETLVTQRNPNPATNGTVLSGDLNGNDVGFTSNGENSYHVVTGSGTDASAILDGFTISGGNGGSGSGGGTYNNGGSPTLTNLTFSSNFASSGGGMYNNGGSPTLTDVTFSGNSASNAGGGMYDAGGSPALTNVTFSGNLASNSGGGMYNNGGSPTLTNLTFSGNSASFGGGIANFNKSGPTIRNSILWGDKGGEIGNDFSPSTPTVTTSIVQGGYPGAGNSIANPAFVAPITATAPTITGNLRLTGGSAAIDAGNNSFIPAGVTTDLDGNQRVIGGTVDLGAYELFLPPTLTNNMLSVTTTSAFDLATATGASLPPQGDTSAFSATGVAAGAINGNMFNPSAVPPGVYTLTYTVTDSHGASNSVNFTVTVPALTLYVNAQVVGGTGAGDSWANAFPSLATALALADNAAAVTQIWVAQGTYTPAGPNGDPNATFQLRSGLAIYGGFTGTETQVTQRNSNPTTNGTILSGDLNGNDGPNFANYDENSRSVVTGSGTDASAILDGFTISDGNASGGNNNGGGMYNDGGSPTLTNLTFSGNEANFFGGGMFNQNSSSPALTNVTFSGNLGDEGGGMYNTSNSHPMLTNLTFSGNDAAFGGGMYNDSCSPTLTNVTSSGNSAQKGGGIYNFSSSNPTIRNSILWGDSGEIFNGFGGTATVTHSIVQGGYAGTGNLDADPQFATGNLRLTAGSPAIDAGDKTVTNPALPATDLDGNPRVVGANVDMGPYEFTAPSFTHSALDVAKTGNAIPLATAIGATPGGGTFSGPGVSNGVFNPAGLAPGNYTITYTTPSGYSANFTVMVTGGTYDFNGDGTSDYLLFNPATSQSAQWNLNGPAFVSSATGPTVTAGWMVVAVADFNGDSQPDYVLVNTTTHQTAIWYMNGTTHTAGAFGPTLPAGWSLVGVADFDGDGHPDYLLFNPGTNQTAIWYMDGASVLSKAYGPTLPKGWEVVGTGDFDGDGHPDFLLFNAGTRQSGIWYLNGTAFVSSAYGPTLPAGWAVDGTADFNGDGHPDYLLFNATTNQMAIWFLNGANHMGGIYVPTLPPGWTVEAVADFNGDHQPDYLLVDDATGQTAVWYGNGTPFAQAVNSPTVTAGWSLVAAADFNGDGEPDYLFFDAGTGQTAIWYMDGATRLSEVYGPTVEAGWAPVVVADFNGDGQPDLLLFNASTRQTAIWYMNGATRLSEVYGPNVMAGWTPVAAADFNGDGHPDLLLFDTSTRQTAIWYMNGPNVLSEVYGPTLPAGWSLVGSADFNVDGQPDYLLFNASTHQSAIWYMNGPAHAGGAFGPTVPTGWSLIAH